ncbi:hypothetical protein HDU84_006869 [Entophlyctis sp. JEL0112]|nr:hypothetical protein HDU84_006869 [Entophlyctis sp. JEL0112]
MPIIIHTAPNSWTRITVEKTVLSLFAAARINSGRWGQRRITGNAELHPVLKRILEKSAQLPTLPPVTKVGAVETHNIDRLARLAGLPAISDWRMSTEGHDNSAGRDSEASTTVSRDIESLITWVEPITKVDTTGAQPLISFAADATVPFNDISELRDDELRSRSESGVFGRELLSYSKSVDAATGIMPPKPHGLESFNNLIAERVFPGYKQSKKLVVPYHLATISNRGAIPDLAGCFLFTIFPQIFTCFYFMGWQPKLGYGFSLPFEVALNSVYCIVLIPELYFGYIAGQTIVRSQAAAFFLTLGGEVTDGEAGIAAAAEEI